MFNNINSLKEKDINKFLGIKDEIKTINIKEEKGIKLDKIKRKRIENDLFIEKRVKDARSKILKRRFSGVSNETIKLKRIKV